MDWVKRNLGFVVGSVVAVALLLFSGYYLYSNSRKNSQAREQLEAEYSELQRLSNLKPHPGKGDVDNIRRAKEQQEELVRLMKKVAQRFDPIPAIPNKPQVSGEDFSASLRRTIDQLNRRAQNASVILPTNYNFSFEAEKRLVKFAPGSLRPLAVQLGEVNALCDVLFNAKVNKLTGLRREPVSPDDRTGPQSDYLQTPSVTNELAVISTYEVSFESFSAELAEVISGFANSSHGLVIKDLYVGPAQEGGAAASRYGQADYTGFPGAAPSIYSSPMAPVPAVPAAPAMGGEFGGAPPPGPMVGGEFGGAMGGGGSQIRRPTFQRPAFGGGQATPYGEMPPQPVAQPYAQPGMAVPGALATAQTLIDEHPLSVTLVVAVIKLLPPQEE
jgi:hypothetical protein